MEPQQGNVDLQNNSIFERFTHHFEVPANRNYLDNHIPEDLTVPCLVDEEPDCHCTVVPSAIPLETVVCNTQWKQKQGHSDITFSPLLQLLRLKH